MVTTGAHTSHISNGYPIPRFLGSPIPYIYNLIMYMIYIYIYIHIYDIINIHIITYTYPYVYMIHIHICMIYISICIYVYICRYKETTYQHLGISARTASSTPPVALTWEATCRTPKALVPRRSLHTSLGRWLGDGYD